MDGKKAVSILFLKKSRPPVASDYGNSRPYFARD